MWWILAMDERWEVLCLMEYCGGNLPEEPNMVAINGYQWQPHRGRKGFCW
ncbi:hypothetical protein SLEP1_g43558 [Rubroshorea leprosula]|uniref:Serine-threonine/tyrosine-protein kinase catalytic domain-containing protein n=1 Tax=Rubroshorea leprosula TaxID=152421 RepID=A0AAV5LE50_9ROSI|nr:hypothetical protein SLEP1_g43558 [Rubroshorea leprosula]